MAPWREPMLLGMRRFLCLSLFVTLLVVGPASAATAQAETTRFASLESALVRQINTVRVARGVRPLSPSAHLKRAASTHSRAMVEQGFFAHESADGTSFADRLKRFYPVRGSWSVSENLAIFGGVAPTAEAVVQAWLDSPAHRANLLGPSFRELGLGVVSAPTGTGAFAGMPVWLVTLDLGVRGTR